MTTYPVIAIQKKVFTYASRLTSLFIAAVSALSRALHSLVRDSLLFHEP
jgi:hypothetical protein